MAAVIGKTNPNPLPVHGPLWFDARQFGVSPQNPDNQPALQAAHDAAIAALAAVIPGFTSVPPKATIFIPGAKTPYTVKTPVFIEGSGIEIRGEGESTQLVTPATNGYPIFYCGLYRGTNGSGSTNSPGSAYRPDVFGKLDTTAASAASRVWGLRTNGDAFIVSQASTFSHGQLSPTTGIPDAWRETTKFTIEFAIEGFASGKVPTGVSFGIGTTANQTYAAQAGCPWVLTTTGTNAYQLRLFTQATRFGPATGPLSFNFSSGASTTGVQKIAVQVDCVAGLVTAYANGTQVAVTGSTLPANSTLNENHYYPFCINAQGDGGGQNLGVDFALYGFSVSLSNRYPNVGVGNTQVAHPQMSYGCLTLPGSPTGGTWTYTYGGVTSAPISATATAAQIQAALQAMSSIGAGNLTVANGSDQGTGINYQVAGANGFALAYAAGQCDGTNLTGGTLKDGYRYFSSYPPYYPFCRDFYELGHFQFTENPSTAPRHLAIQGGGSLQGTMTSALLFNHSSNDAIASNNIFKDIVLNTGTFYGISLALGHTINTTLDGVSARAGLYGAGNFPWGANYYHTVKNCTFYGNDCGYFAYSGFYQQFDNINIAQNNRYSIRLIASGMKSKHVIVGNYGNDPCAFAYMAGGTYGGDYDFDDVTLDLEGGGVFSNCLFYCEATAYAATTLKVRDVYGGQIGWPPIFKLRCGGGPPSVPQAFLDAESVGVDALGGIVDVDGSLWLGEVRNTLGDAGPFVLSSQATGRPRVMVTDTSSSTFPRWQPWYVGTAKVKAAWAPDGLYRELKVAANGTIGSSTPPQWYGTDSFQAVPNGTLGAYGLDHTAISATVSGRASSGGSLTTQSAEALAQTLFGGAVTGTSTVLTISGAGLGGTFTLSYGGQTTAPLAYGASGATVQAALQGLSSVGTGNMSVNLNGDGTYTITQTGALANLAGGILGLTVNGSGLTAAGPSVVLNAGNTSFLYFAGVSGGTFTLSHGGKTTVPLAWNATAATIQAAINTAGITTSYGPQFAVPNAFPGSWYEINVNNVTINSSGLTGGPVATLASASLPSTWYAALLTTNVHPTGRIYTEPYAGQTGYSRVAVANNTTNFGASSAGSKTSGAAITFPTATAPYTVNSIAFFSTSNVGARSWLVIQLASPLIVTAGQTPTIAIGNLSFTHTPYAGHFAGCMTDYAWGKCYDMLFGGVPLTPPTTWYAALSTGAVSRTTTSLAEPAGGAYARKAIANVSANWGIGGGNNNDRYARDGEVRNIPALAFAAPTGTWGTVVAVALADAPTAGNVWFAAPLVTGVAPATGGPTPTFAAGAFVLATS